MPFQAMRSAQLNISVPTIDEIIRAEIVPVNAGGDSISFTIPETAQIGDTVFLFMSWRIYRFCLDFAGMSPKIALLDSGFTKKLIGDNDWSGSDAEIPGFGLAGFHIYQLEAEDIGATFTIPLHNCDPGVTYSPNNFIPILYGMVMKESWYPAESSMGFQEIDTPEGDYGDRLETTVLTSTVPYQLYLFTSTIFPTGVYTMSNATELCNTTIGANSLYVGARIVRVVGTDIGFYVDYDPNITGLAAIVKG